MLDTRRRGRRGRGTGETGDGEGLERRSRTALRNQLGKDVADRGSELEAMPREAEGVDEVRRRLREADDGDAVRHLAVDPGPGPDDVRASQRRHEVERFRHACERLV